MNVPKTPARNSTFTSLSFASVNLGISISAAFNKRYMFDAVMFLVSPVIAGFIFRNISSGVLPSLITD